MSVGSSNEPGSVSFDRAAEFYDATRPTAAYAIEGAVGVLDRHLPAGEPTLEIGVGTGALAVPLSARGRRIVGLDLSEAMLRKLIEKDPAGSVPVVRGDATQLPFSSGAFGGAYGRWVLHLIPAWPASVAELCRVVRPGGSVALDPGGYSGEWREVWLRTLAELGAGSQPSGLDITRDEASLDEAFAAGGAELVGTDAVQVAYEGSLSTFFDNAEQRVYSWTWRVDDDDLHRGIAAARAWAADRYGDVDVPFEPLASHPWRVYRIAAS